jgi:endogenous inhibitor of DNA gyrase (YacG/DUF329 family)
MKVEWRSTPRPFCDLFPDSIDLGLDLKGLRAYVVCDSSAYRDRAEHMSAM